jgi:hypothetical protein
VGRLDDGESKGTIIADLIAAAQAPENAGDAQDQFNNKVAVSDYVADNIETVEDPFDFDDFVDFIEDVDHTDASVTDAQTEIDDALNPPEPGGTFTLTSGTDRDADFVGTSNDDIFDAPIVQNSWVGGVSNSLSSADELDGGAGNDTLQAELVQEFFGVTGDNQIDVQPETMNIETALFEARDVALGSINANPTITVDAKHMTDIDEIGSWYSDGDLIIENLTTLESNGNARNTNAITVVMDHTDNFNSDDDASDLTVYFDEDYLLSDEDISGAQLEIRLLNAVQNEAGNNPVEGFSEITFTVGETEVIVDITSIADDGTLDYTTAYDEIVDAINAQLAADGFDTVTATLGPIEDAVFSIPVAGFATGDDAGDYYPVVVTNTGSEELAGVDIETSALSYDTDLNNSFQASDPETTENPLSVNIELEKVGRDGEGGDLVIGGKDQNSEDDVDVDQTDGIEVFDITVLGGDDKPSNLGVISSTNNELEAVNIDSADPGENSEGEDTWADLTVRGQEDDLTTLLEDETAAPLGQGQELTLIDATDFNGDLAIGMSVIDVDGVATTTVTGVQQALESNFGSGDDSYNWESDEANGVSSDKDYSISMGEGNDTVAADLDGDSVDAFGESFSVSMGSGDDALTVTMDTGVSFETMDELENLTISTGDGADTVDLDAYGTFDITAGDGDDFVHINSLSIDNDPLISDNNGNATVNTITIGNTTGVQDFQQRVLYQAELTVSFAGIEETVSVETDENFIATQQDINDAVKLAISNNTVLSNLLTVTDSTADQALNITSNVGGLNDLAIGIYQPQLVEEDPADGEVALQSSDISALRQGLINTTDLTSADLDDNNTDVADFLTAFNAADDGTLYDDGGDNDGNFSGSINEFGEGDDTNYAYIQNDVALDAGQETGDDLFDAAANGDQYLEYQALGTDANTGLNFSTINLGQGDDTVVLHSNPASSNILRIDGDFDTTTVVNFHNVSPNDLTGANHAQVGNHALEFAYLDNDIDPSVDNSNTQSVTDLSVTVNLVNGAQGFADSDANPDTVDTNEAEANSVNIIRFDSDEDGDTDESFADLDANTLLDALNGEYDPEGDGSDVAYGNLDNGLLTPVVNTELVGNTQKHIIMVENDLNEGEYKVFEVTSTIEEDDAGNRVIVQNDDDNDVFTNATEIGTLDFGGSVNLNVAGNDGYDSYRENLIAAIDNEEATFTYTHTDGSESGVINTEDPAAADTTPPTLDSFTPADDATDVAVGADLVLTFSEAVEAGTGNFTVRDASDNSVVAQVAAADAAYDGAQVTVDLPADLAEGTDYFVTIAQGTVQDAAGNAYAGITNATTFNFTTAGAAADELPALPSEGGPAAVDAGTTASENINGNQDLTISGAGGFDRFIFSDTDTAVTIDDFETGDQLYFEDAAEGDLGFINSDFTDNQLVINAGAVEITLTGLASDTAFNAAGFTDAFGETALAFA